MRKVKAALIGCGAIAREHLAAVSSLANAEMVAVCDISRARAEAAAERFGVRKWYTNYEEMLAELRPDIVHVTSSPASHFAVARGCLSAGANVLCEKPITVEYQEFKELKQLAANYRCLLMENQNFRFHTGVLHIKELQRTGALGDILEIQICISLNLFGKGSPYIDPNQAHATALLRGGVVGDFLPHIGYLSYMFTGPVTDLRTVWTKRNVESQLAFDEFRALIKGEHATAYISFSGVAQPDGFWIRVVGTRACVETNLFEPPRRSRRRLRKGEPALMRLVDGVIEGRDVINGTVAGFWRKLAGTSSYDGIPELIKQTYKAVESGAPAPIDVDEIDAVARLVHRFAEPETML